MSDLGCTSAVEDFPRRLAYAIDALIDSKLQMENNRCVATRLNKSGDSEAARVLESSIWEMVNFRRDSLIEILEEIPFME